MRSKQLKEKYSEIWDQVYNDTISDLKLCLTMAQVDLYEQKYKYSVLERIAHNAAFSACYAVHKFIKK